MHSSVQVESEGAGSGNGNGEEWGDGSSSSNSNSSSRGDSRFDLSDRAMSADGLVVFSRLVAYHRVCFDEMNRVNGTGGPSFGTVPSQQ